jgi:hypothetical protein
MRCNFYHRCDLTNELLLATTKQSDKARSVASRAMVDCLIGAINQAVNYHEHCDGFDPGLVVAFELSTFFVLVLEIANDGSKRKDRLL